MSESGQALGGSDTEFNDGTSDVIQRGRPIVLAFQPTQFRVLEEPEDLRVWETNMRRRVGLPFRGGFAGLIERMNTCCDSECPSIPASGDNIDTDDCDID